MEIYSPSIGTYKLYLKRQKLIYYLYCIHFCYDIIILPVLILPPQSFHPTPLFLLELFISELWNISSTFSNLLIFIVDHSRNKKQQHTTYLYTKKNIIYNIKKVKAFYVFLWMLYMYKHLRMKNESHGTRIDCADKKGWIFSDFVLASEIDFSKLLSSIIKY